MNSVYTLRLDDIDPDADKDLLGRLVQHSTHPNLTCRLRWANGMLAIWDNRAVQHLAINDYAGQRRELFRTSVKGERPIAFVVIRPSDRVQAACDASRSAVNAAPIAAHNSARSRSACGATNRFAATTPSIMSASIAASGRPLTRTATTAPADGSAADRPVDADEARRAPVARRDQPSPACLPGERAGRGGEVDRGGRFHTPPILTTGYDRAAERLQASPSHGRAVDPIDAVESTGRRHSPSVQSTS